MSTFNKLGLVAAITSFAVLISNSTFAQHSDIEFGYDGGMIDIEFGGEGRVFEAEFPTSGLFEQETDDPGFGSEVAEGLGITPFDVIDYNILGPLTYHDGTSFAAVPSGVKIIITDNPSGALDVTDTTVGPISGPGAIGQADAGGDVHTHIEFELDPISLDVPEYGAYGLLMSLSSFEADGVTPTGIADSDPFYIVFNFGLGEEDFEGAVAEFASLVPEPTSIGLVSIATIFACCRRRRLS